MTRRRFAAIQGPRPAAAPVPAQGFSFSELARCIDAALMRRAGSALLASVAGAGLLVAPGPAVADTFLVTKQADTDDGACDVDCSLREAIAAANAAATDDIVDATNIIGAITLGGGEIAITGASNLTITGPGANHLTVDANALSRVFSSSATSTLVIEGMTLANGEAANYGGALYASGTQLVLDGVTIRDSHAETNFGGFCVFAGDLTVTDSTISGNWADEDYGGFYVGGSATLTDSVVSGNTAGDFAGGFAVGGDTVLRRATISGNRAGLDPGAAFGSAGGGISYATLTSYNSTISNNTAATYVGGLWAYADMTLHHTTVTGNTAAGDVGGGLYVRGTTIPILLDNSIVAGNSAGTAGPDIAGGTVISAYSLIGVIPANFTDSGGSLTGTAPNPLSPGLGPLASNGGPTPTHDLLPGSPAIDSGDPTFAPPPDVDQRGAPYVRVYRGRLDMGSVESQPGDLILAHGFELLPAQTVTFSADNLPLDLTDPGAHEATIPVAGIGTVVKVQVAFRFDQPLNDISQLEAVLVAPNEDELELFPQNICGSADAQGTYTFRDDPVPDQFWPGYPCPAGIVTVGQFKPFDPAQSFADAFNGDPGNGTWRLRLTLTTGGFGASLVQADLRLDFPAQ